MDPDSESSPDDVRVSAEQAAAIDALGRHDHAAIDSALLARCDSRLRKVAFVVGSTMTDLGDRFSDCLMCSSRPACVAWWNSDGWKPTAIWTECDAARFG